MALNSIQHANMFDRLERITWLIEIVEHNEKLLQVGGFSAGDHLIMSCASVFCYINKIFKNAKIRARMCKDNDWVLVESVFVMESWDIILLQVPRRVKFEVVGFVFDGTLSENQTVLHMGHHLSWTYHVARVCSPCLEKVNLPSNNSQMTCEKYMPSSEKVPPYPVMGHVWNREFYKNYEKGHDKIELFGRGFHPHVPIIQLTGFSARVEDLGGPIINTSGEIVGMFAGKGSQCVGIHVTALKQFLKYYIDSKEAGF